MALTLNFHILPSTFSNHIRNQLQQVDFPKKHTKNVLGNAFKIISCGREGGISEERKKLNSSEGPSCLQLELALSFRLDEGVELHSNVSQSLDAGFMAKLACPWTWQLSSTEATSKAVWELRAIHPQFFQKMDHCILHPKKQIRMAHHGVHHA